MSADRIRRSGQEILRELFIKKADPSQLLALLKISAFSDWKTAITNNLITRNGLPYQEFKEIHKSQGCELTKEQGVTIQISYSPDIDLGVVRFQGTVDIYKCLTHQTVSSKLVTDPFFQREFPYK